MKSVRLFYKKRSRMRFISHLDMTRFMTRILRRASLPVWYTEGFNPHLYITFALPLSLGFESDYEVMDIRLTDDTYPIDTLCDTLNAVCPPYINFFKAAEPLKKAGAVAFADFSVSFDDGGALADSLKSFLSSDSITVQKKTKKGEIKEIQVSDKIKSFSVETTGGNTTLSIRLPAGSVDNLNPELILSAFFENGNDYYCYIITRTAIYDGDLNLFE